MIDISKITGFENLAVITSFRDSLKFSISIPFRGLASEKYSVTCIVSRNNTLYGYSFSGNIEVLTNKIIEKFDKADYVILVLHKKNYNKDCYIIEKVKSLKKSS